MIEETLIQNDASFPDTHYFSYKNKLYPIKFIFFKNSSNYFSTNENEFYENKNIIPIENSPSENLNFSEETIKDFIKFVQFEKISLNNNNIVDLNYLAEKFQVTSLSKHTKQYIANHHNEIAIQLLSSQNTTFQTAEYEEIISNHLDEYIKDERLLTLKIPVIYRIISKYQQKLIQENQPIEKEIIDFLFKYLNQNGRGASVLFSLVDFGNSKSEHLNFLIQNFSDKFDFHFINSSFLKTIYENESDLIQKEEQNKKQQNDLLLQIKAEFNEKFEQQEQNHNEEIKNFKTEIENMNKIIEQNKAEQSKLKQEYDNEVTNLKTEIENMKETIEQSKIELKKECENEIENMKKTIEQSKIELSREYKSEIENVKNKIEKKAKSKKAFLAEIPYTNNYKGIFNYFKTQSKLNDEVNITTPSNDEFDINNITNIEKTSGIWFKTNIVNFEFKKHIIIPSNYTIRTYSYGTGGCHLKNWVIEGSNDKLQWTELDIHTNCTALNDSYKVHTFSIQNFDHLEDGFKFIRLRQTGPNWINTYSLVFCSIEFYGEII